MTRSVTMRRRESQRIKSTIESARALEPAKRVEFLEQEVQAALAERQLQMLESFSLLFGGTGSIDLINEDPRFDDGEVWDEVGLRGSPVGFPHAHPLLRSQHDLDKARRIGRHMAAENEFAIGAQIARVAYIIGSGLNWRAAPRDLENEDEDFTRKANKAIRDFVEQESWGDVEQEVMWRGDRDGEAILRNFMNADGPMRVRFVEPEFIRQPAETNKIRAFFGIETAPKDPRDVRAYWILPADRLLNETSPAPERVSAMIAGTDLPHVCHLKLNVVLASPRGWPTMHAIRRNLSRAEKLLRNMSYVAALQAAIALIRKHQNASEAQVRSFIESNRDLLVTNKTTGKQTDFRGVKPGTVIDTGPGTTYESPVSSVNASNNVLVLQAELRAAAIRVQMPEYMFSGDSRNANYAQSLVAETPAVKNFERMQSKLMRFLQRIVWTALRHEVFWGRLDDKLDQYELKADLPGLVVRDQLQEAQRRQIMNTRGVLSRITWRSLEGLDDETEERNIDAANTRGYSDIRVSGGGDDAPDGLDPDEPVNPGGGDQAGDPDRPEGAPGQNF